MLRFSVYAIVLDDPIVLKFFYSVTRNLTIFKFQMDEEVEFCGCFLFTTLVGTSLNEFPPPISQTNLFSKLCKSLSSRHVNQEVSM